MGGLEGERRAHGGRPQERLTMHRLSLFSEGDGVRKILALGAHADDIEIGCGGTLLRLLSERSDLEVTWVVFCSTPERAREAEASAQRFDKAIVTFCAFSTGCRARLLWERRR